MPESTIAITNAELKATAGAHLGYGRGAVYGETAWTVKQANNLSELMKVCLAQVIFPVATRPGTPAYNWSWMRPTATILLASGASHADLPEDFGGFEGPLQITASGNRRPWAIEFSQEAMVTARFAARPDASGAPELACERVLKGTTLGRGTRSQVYVWPTADQAYSLSVQYYYLPDALTDSFPYPPGGASVAELYRASVLAAAELELDNERGPRWAYFVERLDAAISADRKRKGQYIGYNGDTSDDARRGRRPLHGYGGNITFNGVDPDA